MNPDARDIGNVSGEASAGEKALFECSWSGVCIALGIAFGHSPHGQRAARPCRMRWRRCVKV